MIDFLGDDGGMQSSGRRLEGAEDLATMRVVEVKTVRLGREGNLWGQMAIKTAHPNHHNSLVFYATRVCQLRLPLPMPMNLISWEHCPANRRGVSLQSKSTDLLEKYQSVSKHKVLNYAFSLFSIRKSTILTHTKARTLHEIWGRFWSSTQVLWHPVHTAKSSNQKGWWWVKQQAPGPRRHCCAA